MDEAMRELPSNDASPYTREQRYVLEKTLPYLSVELQTEWHNLMLDKSPGVQKRRNVLINRTIPKTVKHKTCIDPAKVVESFRSTSRVEVAGNKK